MKIKVAFTTNIDEDHDLNKIVISVIRACNEASARKPAFLMRKKVAERCIYTYATSENIITFLNDCYEIVAVIQKQ